MKSARLVGLGIVLAVGGLSFELRDEGSRIGACASHATALSQVSELVRQSLYPDTDHFLGNVARLHEKAQLESLEAAYRIARRAAGRSRSLFLRTSAAEAREMFLAAVQERNLAANPRGNWISYMSETAKAKTQFETAKARYELDRSVMVRGDAPADVGAVIVLAMAPLRRAVEEAAAALKRENAEAARIQAAKLEAAARVAAYEREVERSCLDQAAALLPILKSLLFDFKQEAEIAVSAPRLSVASEISKLQEIYNKTMRLDEWPAPSCGYVLRSAVGHAEGFDIARLKAFLRGSNLSFAKAAKEHWDYADIQLRLMQDRVGSGRN